MHSVLSRPTTSSTTTRWSGKRLNSASRSISIKTPNTQNRVQTAHSHRPSLVNLKHLDFINSPLHEPSTPSSIPETVKSRPHSKGGPLSPNSYGQRSYRFPKDLKVDLESIVEGRSKTWRGQKPLEEKKSPKGSSNASQIEAIKAFPLADNTRGASRNGSLLLIQEEESSKRATPQKLSLLTAVAMSAKLNQKERSMLESLKEIQQKQEKQEAMSKPIKHSDIIVELSNAIDRQALEDYESEILGTYKNYKSIKDINNVKILKKVDYLKLLRFKLREKDKQEVILTIIKTRSNIRKYIVEKDIKSVVEELMKNLIAFLKFNNVDLLLEILQLFSNTYLDFGQLDNSVFAFNQMRMCAELTDNVSKKIESYLGLAESCKRLKYFDQALLFLKRALHFCWNILDRERELKIYDLIGMIYFTTRDIEKASYYHNRASQGRIENEHSTLFTIANEHIHEYRLQHHICLKSINSVFYARLTLPQVATNRPNPIKTKAGREKLRNLIVHSDDSADNYFKDELILNQTSAFLEKVMTRVYYKKGISETKDTPMFGTALNTQVEAIHQLEVILAELDFNKDIPSPRSFDIKEKKVRDKPSNLFEQPKPISSEGAALGDLDKRRKVITAVQYHNLKKDKEKYSLKEIAKGNHLILKDPKGGIMDLFDWKDEFISFENFKKRAKKQYNSDAIESKLFLNHLSPNRSSHGMPNVPDLRPSRYFRFFERILEYMVYEKENINAC